MQYSEKGARGYPWLSFTAHNEWVVSVLVSLAILAGSVVFFVWCTRVSDDMGGDSFAGLVFAIASTVFMFLAAVSFSLRRRSRKRVVGKLNAVLNWHVCFGTISLVMVFMHAFGNYNPRTGTYALYGMIALVITGIIGRILDRLLPRMIAQEVSKALTNQGEDRIESISRKLQSIVTHNKQEIRTSQPSSNKAAVSSGKMRNQSGQGTLQSEWDMAYLSLEETPQEINRYNQQYRFVPDQRSALVRPGALYPGAQDHIGAIEDVQAALQKETMYRYIIRLWRAFHIFLAILTVGLTLWHIEYALALIMPALQKYGFGYLLPWP